MRHFCLILLIAGGPAFADEWRPLSGKEIREALADRTVDYEAAWQRFIASGRTLHNAGQDSWDNWDVWGRCLLQRMAAAVGLGLLSRRSRRGRSARLGSWLRQRRNRGAL